MKGMFVKLLENKRFEKLREYGCMSKREV